MLNRQSLLFTVVFLSVTLSIQALSMSHPIVDTLLALEESEMGQSIVTDFVNQFQCPGTCHQERVKAAYSEFRKESINKMVDFMVTRFSLAQELEDSIRANPEDYPMAFSAYKVLSEPII